MIRELGSNNELELSLKSNGAVLDLSHGAVLDLSLGAVLDLSLGTQSWNSGSGLGTQDLALELGIPETCRIDQTVLRALMRIVLWVTKGECPWTLSNLSSYPPMTDLACRSSSHYQLR